MVWTVRTFPETTTLNSSLAQAWINFLLFVMQNRQFYQFIIITMILLCSHDSAIRWEEVLL